MSGSGQERPSILYIRTRGVVSRRRLEGSASYSLTDLLSLMLEDGARASCRLISICGVIVLV